MKNKTIIISAVIMISLIFAGCTTLTNFSAGGKQNPITSVDVYKGTNGLDIEFLKNTPPDQIFQGESFQVTTRLNNKGAYPITSGKLVLTYEPDYVNGASSTTTSTFNLKGKDTYDPTDHDIMKNFYFSTYSLDSKSIDHTSIILATACYDYGTKLNSEVCIDTDPNNVKLIEKPCQTQDMSFSGQGAPISITKVEEKMLVSDGNTIRPQFQVYISNDGGGQAVARYSLEKACGSNSIDRNDLNKVTLKSFKFSDYTLSDMDCVPNADNLQNPVLTLRENENYFVCTLKAEKAITPDTSTFRTNLYIELEYGYTVTKSKEFTIKKIIT